MKFASGVVQWLAADAAAATYIVSGLEFQPKAIRFYWIGLGSATDLTSNDTVHERAGVGFAVGASSRRCVAVQDQTTQGSTVCTTGYRDDCVAMTLTSTPAVDGLLDLSSITSDGFILVVDDQAPVDMTVAWEAWGGDDVTAVIGDIAEPAATGVQDYTATGFRSDDIDQVVMFAGVQETGASPAVSRNDSGLCVGFASGLATNENIVVLGNSDDGSANTDTDGYCKTGECLAMIAVGGGNATARAQLTQWNTDGFRLNWIARATSNRRYIFLAVKGGLWKAGSYTIDTAVLGNTATVSGLPFTPIGICVIGAEKAESAAGVSAAQEYLSLGTVVSPSSRRQMGLFSLNGGSDSVVRLSLQYDEVVAYEASQNGSITDIDAVNSDGFRMIIDGVPFTPISNTWQGYLAFGSNILSTGVRVATAQPALVGGLF